MIYDYASQHSPTTWVEPCMSYGAEPKVRATFFSDSAPLPPADVLANYDRWTAGETVTSRATAVGHVALTDEEASLLSSPTFSDQRCRQISESSVEWPRYAGLHDAFVSVVRQDAEQSGLGANFRVRMLAGYYDADEWGTPWHVDYHDHPIVRYTAAWGIRVGSTLFAAGPISAEDVSDDPATGGNLLPHAVVGEGGKLQEIPQLPDGTVARFTNAGTVHAGPDNDGPRIFLQATFDL